MSDRVVKVSLIASVNNYVAGLEKAERATYKATTEAEKQAKRLDANRKVMGLVGTAAVALGGAVTLGLGVAVAKYAEFDQAMSGVAATGDEARKNIDALTDAAIDAGARTVFSAKESANAIEELAKAGLSTGDILNGGLNGALDLAAAGGMDVADAAGVAATTLGQFQLEGKDASHVADLLAAGAGKAMGDVSDLAYALSQSGTVAHQFGIDVDDTVGTLAAFANAGMLGSDAGTSFRTMLLRLANPTGKAASKMKELGIQAYDAQGKFVGMEGLAGQLQDTLSGLTQEQRNAALAIIFGQDAIRAANVLYTEGKDGIAKWNDAVDESGYASKVAATRLDNLRGDLEQLGGAFDSAMIGMGKAADGPLRGVVQMLTGMIDIFNDMPAGAQQAVFWIGAVGAAGVTTGGAFLLAVPKIAAYKAALASMSGGAQKAIGVLSKVGLALGGVTAGVSLGLVGYDLLKKAFDSLGPSAAEMSNKVATATDAMDFFNAALEKAGRTDLSPTLVKTLPDALDSLAGHGHMAGIQVTTTDNALRDIGDTLTLLASQDLPTAQKQFKLLATSTGLNREQTEELLNRMPSFKKALTDQATQLKIQATDANLVKIALGEMGSATDAAKGSTDSAADAYLNAANEASNLDEKVSDLINTINKANGVGQDAVTANIAYKNTLADVNKKINESKKAWGENTQAGRDNKSMLVDLAKKSQDAAKATFDVDGKTDKYRKTLIKGRKQIIKAAEAMGASKKEAKKLADQIYKIPSKREIDIIADTSAAKRTIQDYMREYGTRYGAIYYRSTVLPDLNGNVSGSGRYGTFASGGYVPGTPSHADNMLAHVASGEFVTRTAQAQKPGNRRVLEWMNAGGDFGSYAGGGFVKPQYADPYRPVASSAPVRSGPAVEIVQKGNQYFSYNPHDVVREQKEQMTRALDAAGVRVW